MPPEIHKGAPAIDVTALRENLALVAERAFHMNKIFETFKLLRKGSGLVPSEFRLAYTLTPDSRTVLGIDTPTVLIDKIKAFSIYVLLANYYPAPDEPMKVSRAIVVGENGWLGYCSTDISCEGKDMDNYDIEITLDGGMTLKFNSDTSRRNKQIPTSIVGNYYETYRLEDHKRHLMTDEVKVLRRIHAHLVETPVVASVELKHLSPDFDHRFSDVAGIHQLPTTLF